MVITWVAAAIVTVLLSLLFGVVVLIAILKARDPSQAAFKVLALVVRVLRYVFLKR